MERTGRGLGETGQPVLATSSGKPQTSPVIDPVALVREEIINKQTQILKKAVAICFILIRPAFSMEQFKDYLKNHQKLVTDALENPVTKRDIEAQLQQAEVSGYKKFNQEFAKVARPVAWDGSSTTGEKTQVVKNKAGQEVCTLKEKTSSQVFTAPDGSTKQVSIRSIEFPPSLKEGSGPMHASFALKDASGHNMPAKDAVYFTVHYDKSGKLMGSYFSSTD